MGKGGGQSATQTQIQDVPDWAKPDYQRLLQATRESIFDISKGADGVEQVSFKPYQAYEGQRLAETPQDITTSQEMIRGIAGTPITGMPEAMDAARRGMGYQEQAIQGMRGLADYQTGQFDPYAGFRETAVSPYAGFQAADTRDFAGEFQAFDPTRYEGFREAEYSPFGEFQQFQFRPAAEFSGFEFRPDYQFQQFQYQQPERFTGAAVEQYMSPYMQSVVEQQQRQAQLEFERQGAGRAAQAVQAGAFGGSRQAVQEALAEEALGRQMADIQARGSQAAFEQAAQQFGLDRAARMEAERAQAGEAARFQAAQAGEMARVDQARYTELANREQAQAAEFARAGDQAAAEAARYQAARYQDLARIQEGRAQEMGRVQAAQAAENARMDAIMQQEMARVQAGRVGELGRAQALTAGEAARIQDAQARELARTQGISVEEAARIQASQAAEQARVQQAVEQSRQFGAGQGLAAFQAMGAGAGQLAGLGAGLAGLGERERAADIQGAQLLEAQGLGEMAREQAGLDVAYQDFLRQQEYPFEQLGRYSTMLRGLPVQGAGTTTTYQPQPSPFQQALGAGISAYGLYRGLQ